MIVHGYRDILVSFLCSLYYFLFIDMFTCVRNNCLPDVGTVFNFYFYGIILFYWCWRFFEKLTVIIINNQVLLQPQFVLCLLLAPSWITLLEDSPINFTFCLTSTFLCAENFTFGSIYSSTVQEHFGGRTFTS